ncbi:hypothetical protein PV327_008860 [Microctonus hyperodae]|uniref:Uncharacterized protein n=1 Tax=Microctonus hyperodae TaxID=165561 RepID=A0AA39KVD4_MICHY|nr:hypothetical protein PV327_008860 [Microctonus hyperodae]
MTLIEGVGDEVTNFFIIVGVILAGWIAWCSTNISEQPLIHTVLILQHRTRTRIAEFRANIQQPTRIENRTSVNSDESSEEILTPSNDTTSEMEPNCTGENQEASQQVSSEETNPLTVTSTAASEEVLIEAMDSLNDNNTRLLRRPTKLSVSETTNTSESSSVLDNDSVTENSANESNEITVKLKFINDDQKLVTGRLKELLGDFKK